MGTGTGMGEDTIRFRKEYWGYSDTLTTQKT